MNAGSERFTIDSNLLIYSVDRDAGTRRQVAIDILDRSLRRDCWLTLQAIAEFYFATTRKRLAPRSEAAALANDWLEAFRTAAATRSAVRSALGYASAGRASYWDALLVATAAEAGCTLVLTEDMADGSKLGGVEVHNPFAASGGLTLRARAVLGIA